MIKHAWIHIPFVTRICEVPVNMAVN